MPAKHDPRLPLEPLERALGSTVAYSTIGGRACGERAYDATDLAELAGATRRAVARWREAGSVPFHYADRIACRLGVHPIVIWGRADYFDCGPLTARSRISR